MRKLPAENGSTFPIQLSTLPSNLQETNHAPQARGCARSHSPAQNRNRGSPRRYCAWSHDRIPRTLDAGDLDRGGRRTRIPHPDLQSGDETTLSAFYARWEVRRDRLEERRRVFARTQDVPRRNRSAKSLLDSVVD